MAPCSCRQVGWYLQSPVTSFSFMSTKPGRTERAKRTLDGWDGQTLTACVGYKYRVVILCHRWKLFAIQYMMFSGTSSHQSLLFLLCQPNLVEPHRPSGLWVGEMVKLSLRVLVINTEGWYFAINGKIFAIQYTMFYNKDWIQFISGKL